MGLKQAQKGTIMVVEVYADIIFLINFVINTVILWICGILRRKAMKLWRVILGGAATALLYTFIIFTPLGVFINILTSFMILAPGIFLAYTVKNLKDFAASLLTAYICAFAMGGIALAASYFFESSRGDVLWSTYGAAAEGFSLQNLVVAIIISFGLLKFAKERIFKKMLAKQVFCRFRVHLSGDVVELNALVDTGNSLTEPISRWPVVIAEFDKIKALLPEAVVGLYNQKNQEDLAALAACFAEGGFATRIRMIPYAGIGKSGVITGFRPDKIEINNQEIKEVIIGICDFTLSSDGEYQALMNPLLI